MKIQIETEYDRNDASKRVIVYRYPIRELPSVAMPVQNFDAWKHEDVIAWLNKKAQDNG